MTTVRPYNRTVMNCNFVGGNQVDLGTGQRQSDDFLLVDKFLSSHQEAGRLSFVRFPF